MQNVKLEKYKEIHNYILTELNLTPAQDNKLIALIKELAQL